MSMEKQGGCRERTYGEHNIYILIFEGLSCRRTKLSILFRSRGQKEVKYLLFDGVTSQLHMTHNIKMFLSSHKRARQKQSFVSTDQVSLVCATTTKNSQILMVYHTKVYFLFTLPVQPRSPGPCSLQHSETQDDRGYTWYVTQTQVSRGHHGKETT